MCTLAVLCIMLIPAQATETPNDSPAAVLASLQPSPYRTVYPLVELESRTWADKVNFANVSFVSDSSPSASRVRPGPTAWWNSFTQTARSYRTTLIIIGVATSMLAVAAISARRMLKMTDKMGGVNITDFICC